MLIVFVKFLNYFLNVLFTFDIFQVEYKINVLPIHVSKMEILNFLHFESDSVVCVT